MSRNEDITTGIWVDLMDLPTDAKLLYIWSWTNEHNNMSGLYKIHRSMIELETGIRDDALTVALERLASDEFLFYVDGAMLVRTRVKRLRTKSAQIAKSVARHVSELHADHPLRVRFLTLYGAEKWLRDAFSEAGLVRLKRGSIEVHVNADKQGDSLSLKRTSVEVPLSGQVVNSSSTEDVGGEVEDHALAQLPAGFPDELVPHLDAVVAVLRALAERHGAKAVQRLAVASVVMARPHKPLVRSAHDFASWADGQVQRRKDVVSGYRHWLDRTDDLAAVEVLTPGNGHVVKLARPEALRRADGWLNAPEYGGAS